MMKKNLSVPFFDLKSKTNYKFDEGRNCLLSGNDSVEIKNGIPRFVSEVENYAEKFGFQWNYWDQLLSDKSNGSNHKKDLLLKRTKFTEFELEGKTLLECGCGGGDDTEILLTLPFKQIYSFDLSNAVDRAKRNLGNRKNLILFQASILDIPFEDDTFDFVFCHRVLQHTPNPKESLKKIIQKVKPGGILFVHSYHRSKNYMQEFKYKYRFFFKKLPAKWVLNYVNWFGSFFYFINRLLFRYPITREFARRYIPFYHYPSYANFNIKQLIELSKLVTFDALTPEYDYPLTYEELKGEVEKSGFDIVFSNPNPKSSPIYLTARKKNKDV